MSTTKFIFIQIQILDKMSSIYATNLRIIYFSYSFLHGFAERSKILAEYRSEK